MQITKSISKDLDDWHAKRSQIMARQSEIMTKAGNEGRTLDSTEAAEYDALEADLDATQAHIRRLESQEASQMKNLRPIGGQSGPAAPMIHTRKFDGDLPYAGAALTRYAIAKAIHAMEDGERPVSEIAKHRWGKKHPNLVNWIKSGMAGHDPEAKFAMRVKSGVAGGGSASTDWGEELVQIDGKYTGDFIEYLAQRTVYDQLGLREVPHNVVISGQDGIGTGYWVGEAKAIPVSAQDFSEVSLTPLKVAAISVISNELIRDSNPSAEMLVRDGLVEAVAQRIDSTFLSTSAASAAVSPAGILNGLSSLGSNGITAAALRQDIQELFAPFLAAYNASDLSFVMNKSLAKNISLLTNALGVKDFPELTQNGGTLEGDPVVTGDNVGATHLILLKPRDIWKIGDLGLQVSLSREATIEQDDSPQGDSEGPTAASATLMSMWQTESTAFKVVRPINFQKRRSDAVAYIADAQYNTTGATTA